MSTPYVEVRECEIQEVVNVGPLVDVIAHHLSVSRTVQLTRTGMNQRFIEIEHQELSVSCGHVSGLVSFHAQRHR
jgi:hypothetical protein